MPGCNKGEYLLIYAVCVVDVYYYYLLQNVKGVRSLLFPPLMMKRAAIAPCYLYVWTFAEPVIHAYKLSVCEHVIYLFLITSFV